VSKYSDHNEPQFDINGLLPEVYQSDVNQSVFSTAFNRHLTKDDTQRVAGFIGAPNPAALVDRQIKEPTPHRQGYQLAPTAYTKVGTTEKALSFKAFEKQLQLMGVDLTQYPDWGNTLQFNWVPPVNIDMLVNFSDYFWQPPQTTSSTTAALMEAPQYFTIENRCLKAKHKVDAFQTVLNTRGSVFAITQVNVASNSFVISGKLNDLFVTGITFFTTGSSSPNFQNRYWTVSSASFDAVLNLTTIVVLEPIAMKGATPPAASFVGQWWFDSSTNTLKAWNGTAYVATSSVITANISLLELLSVYEAQQNCACSESLGWDISQWDDNQIGAVIWDSLLLSNISFPTEQDWKNNAALLTLQLPLPPNSPYAGFGLPWITSLGIPQNFVLWYNTTNDTLYQSINDGINPQFWNAVAVNFSAVIALTTGTAFWDYDTSCVPQTANQWSTQNNWVHKSQVSSFSSVHRAQLPIFEYDSALELNEWVSDIYGWKYRANTSDAFTAVTTQPSRFELDPIKGYEAVNKNGIWYLYLFDKSPNATIERDIDYTGTFVPGYTFRVVDNTTISDTYIVQSAEYRETNASDPVQVQSLYMVTIITLAESKFVSPTVGGGPNDVRLEPTVTSQGNPWRGYHLHWMMDTSTLTTTPTSSQSWNLYRRRSLEASITPTATAQGTLFVGQAHQELTVTVANVQTITLDPTLVFNPLVPNLYALAGGQDLRVYVNNVRQYGNYTEITATGTPSYTVIGHNTYTNITFQYVTGITFSAPLNVFDIVRIEVGPAAFSDMGMSTVPVRTIEDEVAFANAVVAGTQPVYMSRSTYRQVEQNKSKINQYPLFNVYDVVTGAVVNAASLFAFAESPAYPISPIVQRRIVEITSGKEYQFTQTLVDVDNGILYGYRDTTTVSAASITPTIWWYNPATNLLQGWDGKAWTAHPLFSISGTYAVRVPVVSSTEPASILTVQSALWYNPTSNRLFSRNINTYPASWVEIPGVIAGADPSLRTVWKHGLHNEQVVPGYVDANLQPVAVGSASGDWQLPDQWKLNPEHKNHKNILFSELVTHFGTILKQQPPIPGLLGGGMFTLTQDQFNYGLGGTIKEHNDSFDTLISAVNVDNVTPIGAIEFAQNEYAGAILDIRNLFSKLAITALSPSDIPSILNMSAEFANDVITQYSASEFAAQIYGDSSAYDAATKTGIQNWISTVPMFNLGKKYVPHINVSGDFVEIFHHDGHRSQVTLTSAEADYISRQLVAQVDTRSVLGTLGVLSTSAPPSTVPAYDVVFNGGNVLLPILPGTYWYNTTSPRTLYRLQVYVVASVAPTFYFNGVEIPNGTVYYDTTVQAVFQKSGLSWVQITTTGAQNIAPLWQAIDMRMLLADVLLEVEQRLYNVTPSFTKPAFDYTTLRYDVASQAVFAKQSEARFNAFVNDQNIKAPLTNTTYNVTDAFTWNYVSSIIHTPPRTTLAPAASSCWQEMYTDWYGTPYPHLEPWCLQGYTDKPTWWDGLYRDPTNTRTWTDAMWNNIFTGTVPAGYPYPNGVVSTGSTGVLTTYNYVSVNTSSVTLGGYAPDQVLPPYFNVDQIYSGSQTIAQAFPRVRSMFTHYSTEIVSPDADYTFGSGGPTEWLWSTSIRFAYDQPIIAFLMQPPRFLHAAFGPQYTIVDGLQVELVYKRVFAHQNTLFHGDVYNTNLTYYVRGLNQWYVNYNRHTGYDTNTQFRSLWTKWAPLLTYQFAGIIDTETFEISNRNFAVNDQDYNIILANNGVINEMWADAFEVSILSIPPSIIQVNNQSLWKLEVANLTPIPRTLNYYGVKSYSFIPDITTDTIHLLRYKVTEVVQSLKTFYVSGNQTHRFGQSPHITVVSSAHNNGTYTIKNIVYDPVSDSTRVIVNEAIPHPAADGFIDLVDLVVSWVTGDEVVITSTQTLPAPIVADTAYYVIKLANNTYKLAETVNDAYANIPVDLISLGNGQLAVAQVASSFSVFGGVGNSKETWYHFALDLTDQQSVNLPSTFTGIQEFINFVDGYAYNQRQSGLLVGTSESAEFDPNTGRTVDWQLEVERLIDWAYGIRNTSIVINDKYAITVDITNNTMTFVDSTTPQWASGTQVKFSTAGILPAPLLADSTYFVQQTGTPGVFQLSYTSHIIDANSYVALQSAGNGTIYVSLYNRQNVFPAFEVNPTRNAMWVSTPQGVLSNVLEGPYIDITAQQLVFDQYGRPLQPDKFTVYRDDKRSKVSIRPGIVNDLEKIYQNDPYHFIHFGGARFFVEGYEHFVLFNEYSVGGDLIYDSFIGLNATRFNVDYFEKKDYSLRPTLGGYFLHNQHFKRNMEGAAQDMKLIYDALGSEEASPVSQRSHALIGYQGRTTALDLLNVNAKSQFLFYRGMLPSKGSVNSVAAYINSRRFVDAKMDEFWAWKLAEFGDARTKTYPEIKLVATDGALDDIRFQFLANSELETDPDVMVGINEGFAPISFRDSARWNNYPEQKNDIVSPLFLDAEMSTMAVIFSGAVQPEADDVAANNLQYWYDGANLHSWTGTAWSTPVSGKLHAANGSIYWVHDTICDEVRVIRHDLVNGNFNDYTALTFIEGTGVNEYHRVNSEVVRFQPTGFHDIMIIFTVNPAKRVVSPAKLVDTKAATVISNIPVWHPAKGYHYDVAQHNVDIQVSADPAKYQITLNPNDVSLQAWNEHEAGKVWLDTSYLGYLPYYDNVVTPDVNDRLHSWGKLAPWADTKVYKWTKSTTAPSGYDALVTSQATNSAILQNDKATGTPRKTTFRRARTAMTATVSNIAGNLFVAAANTLVEGDTVVFTTTGTLPGGIVAATKYAATNVSGLGFYVKNLTTNTLVPYTTAGTGTLKAVPSFKATSWVRQILIRDKVYGAFDVAGATPVLPLRNPAWNAGDVANVYKNGVLVASGLVTNDGITLSTTGTSLTVSESDIVDVVRPLHVLTAAETSFNPDVSDDGTVLVQWKQDYEYTTVTVTTGSTSSGLVPVQYYYFWVENSTNRNANDNSSLSVFETAQQLKNMPAPYFVMQNPKDDPQLVETYGYGVVQYGATYSLGQLADQFLTVPVLYRQLVIRRISNYITEDNRFIMRFTRDFTLRDDIRANGREMNLKEKHEEWYLFRRQQPSTIPLQLWNRLVEAMIGYTLADSTVRVPSLERELYDASNGTNTRYGLGTDQAFVDKNLAVPTIIAYLQDPANNFYPVSIDDFFAAYSFDTPANIQAAMQQIYNTFPAEHVNSIWFSALADALTTKPKYKELMKTSWIALHGIRVLEVGGLFDD